MTGQSLFYMGESDLAHKVLSIAEEEGASRAAYALKLLQSEGELSIASTGKDTASGRLVTHTYKVTGPTAIVLTTTAIDIDEELLNRCLVLTIDEDRDQTRAIHQAQRRAQTLEGLAARTERDQIIGVHRHAQRLLEPLAVVNPFADRLTFADGRTRTRPRSRQVPRADRRGDVAASAPAGPEDRHDQRPDRVLRRDHDRWTSRSRTGSRTPCSASRWTSWPRRPAGCSPPSTTTRPAKPSAWRSHSTWSGSPADSCASTSPARAAGGVTPSSRSTWARLVDLELVMAHRLETGAFGYELTWNPPVAMSTTIGRNGDDVGQRFLAGLTDPSTLLETTYTAGPVGSDEPIYGYNSEPVGAEVALVGAWSGPGRGVVGPRSEPDSEPEGDADDADDGVGVLRWASGGGR